MIKKVLTTRFGHCSPPYRQDTAHGRSKGLPGEIPPHRPKVSFCWCEPDVFTKMGPGVVGTRVELSREIKKAPVWSFIDSCLYS